MRSVSEGATPGIEESLRSTSSVRAVGGPKPLPLKQRTSSVDARRDYSMQTVLSLIGLIKLREYFITVDNFSIWRRHLAWAMENGGDLRSFITQRFASSMVFMSLLLGAELNVLFNSAAVTSSMRRELFAENFRTVEFWAGIAILVSVVLTILSLISTFTAWGMVSSVSESNAHCILRSSIGQYAAELPGRFIVTAVYSFLIWVALFFFLLLPVGFWSILLMVTTAGLFFHVVVVFSAFGRIIMHTGAMGTHRIFDEATEQRLRPHTLHSSLLEKAKLELARNTSIMRQYRRKQDTPNVETGAYSMDAPPEPRKRADSSVRFADTLWTSVPPRDVAAPLSDIASAQGGAETPSSQVSVASSSDARAAERPKRPPRPTAGQGVHHHSSEGSSFVDALGGSNHSLEAWLKASGPTKPESGKGDASEKPARSDEQRSSTPVGFGPLHLGDKPRGGRESPIDFGRPSNTAQPRDGRGSVSPIDSDMSGSALDGTRQPFWRPPSSIIPVNRSHSTHSSIDGGSSNNLHRDRLTEEEKFDEEYGELFAAQEANEQRNDSAIDDSRGYEVEYGHEDSYLELSGEPTEQQRLLPERGDNHESGYAAVDTVQNQEKRRGRQS